MVDCNEASERLGRLQALVAEQRREIQDDMVNRTVSVLFEKPGRLPGQMAGRSDYLHPVHVVGADVLAGDIRKVRIAASQSNSLAGELI